MRLFIPLLLASVLALSSADSVKTPRHAYSGSASGSNSFAGGFAGAGAGSGVGSFDNAIKGGASALAGSFGGAGAIGGGAAAPFWWAGPDSPFKAASEYFQRCSLKGNCENLPGPFNIPIPNNLPSHGCNSNGCSYSGSYNVNDKSGHGAGGFNAGGSAGSFNAGGAGSFNAGGAGSFNAGGANKDYGSGTFDISKNPFLNGEYQGISVSSCSGNNCPGGKPQTVITTTNCKGQDCKTNTQHGNPQDLGVSGQNPFLPGGSNFPPVIGGCAGTQAGCSGSSVHGSGSAGAGGQNPFLPGGSNIPPVIGGCAGTQAGCSGSSVHGSGSAGAGGQNPFLPGGSNIPPVIGGCAGTQAGCSGSSVHGSGSAGAGGQNPFLPGGSSFPPVIGGCAGTQAGCSGSSVHGSGSAGSFSGSFENTGYTGGCSGVKGGCNGGSKQNTQPIPSTYPGSGSTQTHFGGSQTNYGGQPIPTTYPGQTQPIPTHQPAYTSGPKQDQTPGYTSGAQHSTAAGGSYSGTTSFGGQSAYTSGNQHTTSGGFGGSTGGSFSTAGSYGGQGQTTTGQHGNGGVSGQLTIKCFGQGLICVKKHLCNNGVVNNNGEGLLNVRDGDKYCDVNSETCCRIPGASGEPHKDINLQLPTVQGSQPGNQYYTTNSQHTASSASSAASTGSSSTTYFGSHGANPTAASGIASQYNPGQKTPSGGNYQPGQTIPFGGKDGTSPGLIHILPEEDHPAQVPYKPGQPGLIRPNPEVKSPGLTHILPNGELSTSKPGLTHILPNGELSTTKPGLTHILPNGQVSSPNPGLTHILPNGQVSTPRSSNPFEVYPNGGESTLKPGASYTPTYKDVNNDLSSASTIRGPAYLPPGPSPSPSPSGYSPDLIPPPGRPTVNQYQTSPKPYYPPPKPTQSNEYLPPSDTNTSPVYVPTTKQPYQPYQPPTPKPYQPQPTPYQPTPKPYQPQPQPTPKPYQPQPTPYQPQPTPYQPQPRPTPKPYQPQPYQPQPQPTRPNNNGYLPPVDPNREPAPSDGNNQYLPPTEVGTDSSIIRVNVISQSTPKYQQPTPPLITGENVPDISRVRPPTTGRTTRFEENVTPYPGCAAALKCVQGDYCTAEGVISPSRVLLTPEQEINRVPLTECLDPESGIIGKCCRDPDYKDPWPSTQLGLFDPDNSGAGSNTRPNVNRPNQGVKGRPQVQPPRPRNPYEPNQLGSPSNNPNAVVGYPVNVPSIPFDSRQVNPPLQVDAKPPLETDYSQKFPISVSKLNTETCGIRHPNAQPAGPGPIDANFGEIPWQAMVLRDSNRSLLCGGAIIRRDVVLTAAHCVENLQANDVLVKGGEWKLGIDEEPKPFQINKVAAIVRHPGYRPENRLNDIALLILTEKFRLDRNVDTLCLPAPEEDIARTFQKAKCITTGWGKTILQLHIQNSLMHILGVGILPGQQCQQQLQQYHSDSAHLYNTNCVCGAPTQPQADICEVDIGSALACDKGDGRYTLAGIYSWDTGCNPAAQVAGYTKVDTHWIESTLQRPINDLKTEERGFYAQLQGQECHCAPGK